MAMVPCPVVNTQSQVADLNGVGDFIDRAPAAGPGAFHPNSFTLNAPVYDQLAVQYPQIVQESIPSPWAQAEAFRRRLVSGNPYALQEWGAILFLVHFERAKIELMSRDRIQKLDPELEPALFQTPAAPRRYDRVPGQARAVVESLGLVVSRDSRVCLGGAHPDCLVFPARERAAWDGQAAEWGLEGKRLSLDRLLGGETPDRKEHFATFVDSLRRSVAEHQSEDRGLAQALGALLANLGRSGVLPRGVPTIFDLGTDPYAWRKQTAPAPGSKTFLEEYPLIAERGDRRFVLTCDRLDPELNPWLRQPFSPNQNLAFDQVRAVKGDPLQVAVGGQALGLPDGYEVFPLRDCLLDLCWDLDPVQLPEGFTRSVNYFNQARGLSLPVSPSLLTVAPLDALGSDALRRLDAAPDNREDWGLRLSAAPGLGRFVQEVRWKTRRVPVKAFQDVRVECWPPRLSERWKLYFLNFSSVRKDVTGTWKAFTGDGRQEGHERKYCALDVESRGENYVQVLSGPPRVVAFEERGTFRGLFALDQRLYTPAREGERPDSLAVDLGASNTCIAWREVTPLPTQPPIAGNVLEIDLSGVILWGYAGRSVAQRASRLGWFPETWAESPLKTYFPSELWYRGDAAALQGRHLPEALPWIDCRGMRHPLEHITLLNREPVGWVYAGNLKWGSSMDRYGPGAEGFNTRPREIYLEYVLMISLAQLFFGSGNRPGFGQPPRKIIFTYPLALQSRVEEFKRSSQAVVDRIRDLLFPERQIAVEFLSESAAVAAYVREHPGIGGDRTLTVDIGGSTADISVLKGPEARFFDSLEIAGSRFFDIVRTAVHHRHKGFKQILGRMKAFLAVTGEAGDERNTAKDTFLDHIFEAPDSRIDRLNRGFGVCVRLLSDAEVLEHERIILDGVNALADYVAFSAHAMFSHILSYALVLGAADVMEEVRTKPGDPEIDRWLPKFSLKIAGNGAGLLPFATLSTDAAAFRAEAERCWEVVKVALLESLGQCRHPGCDHANQMKVLENIRVGSVELLGRGGNPLVNAKASVALGAILGSGGRMPETGEVKTCFGVEFRDLRLDGRPQARPVHWFDPLDVAAFEQPDGVRVFKRIEFPVSRLASGAPLHALQGALVMAMGVGREIGLDAAGYEIWNKRIQADYDQPLYNLLPIGDCHKLTRSPLAFLVTSFYQGECKLRDDIARSQGLLGERQGG